MTRRPNARAAFTLIELLVVISIIAVLAALTGAVFARVRAAQAKSNTDATLNKINSLIERRWKAVLDQVTDDIKSNHPGYSTVLGQVQNPDLAKAIWTYAKMKNELPMSLAEAKNPVAININGTVVWNIPAKAMFATLPAEPVGPNQAFDESASCLFAAVTANAGGGTATDQDGIQQQTATTGGGAKCFKDGWGTPIAFVRTAYNSEVNGSPFIRANAAFDPFDPMKKLVSWGGRDQFWNAIKPNVGWANQTAAMPLAAPLNVPVSLAQNTYPGAVNHTWTAISAGPNKLWGTDPYGLPPIIDTDPSKDNQLSYRLRREGNRGD